MQCFLEKKFNQPSIVPTKVKIVYFTYWLYQKILSLGHIGWWIISVQNHFSYTIVGTYLYH